MLRLRDDAFGGAFKNWLENWDSSSLIFLSDLRDARLIDLDKRTTVVHHRLETRRRDSIVLDLKGEPC